MQIAVTGATGFIGRHVVTEAIKQGHDIIAVSRSRQALAEMTWSGSVTACVLDISDATGDVFERIGRPDVCIHLAWGELANFKSLAHFETELPRHHGFLRSLVRSGLMRLLVTGTCLEYGLQSGCLSEELPTDPITPYGLAKDMLRRQLEFLQQQTPFSLAWARLFYIYGEAAGRKTLYMLLKEAVERGDDVFPMSPGEQLRDYMPVEQIAGRLVQLATTTLNPGVVNISSGEPVSVRRLVEGWIEANSWEISMDLGQYDYPTYEPLAFWGDQRKFDRLSRE